MVTSYHKFLRFFVAQFLSSSSVNRKKEPNLSGNASRNHNRMMMFCKTKVLLSSFSHIHLSYATACFPSEPLESLRLLYRYVELCHPNPKQEEKTVGLELYTNVSQHMDVS